jgi:hypothetical protein
MTHGCQRRHRTRRPGPVVSARDGGRSLIAAYRNDTWGEMRTTWAFTIAAGKISRFETGQATP